MMKRLTYLVPLGLFAVVCVYFAVGLTMNPRRIPSALLDRNVPEFDLPPIDGRDRGLASRDLRDDVILVNFFASWCVSCRAEHDMLMKLTKTRAVPLHGINWKDGPGQGPAWLKKLGDPYVQIGDDPGGRVGIDFGVTGLPETFVVDRAGRIRYKQIGPITPEIWRAEIAPLIARLRQE